MRNIKLILVFCLTIVSSLTMAQVEVNKEQLAQADKFFDDGHYLEALEIYRQLLSVNSDNHMLNYKYGACLIYSEEDTDQPVKYLRYATTGQVEPLAYYYKGIAFHHNYQFADAQQAYQEYLTKSDRKDKKMASLTDRKIEMCKNGQALLSNIKDISVLEKVETSEKEFFRSYKLDDLGGKIIVTPDELLSKNDKSSGEYSLIYFNPNNEAIYYSSYGSGQDRDIYMVLRMANGKFTKPKKVLGGVNTEFDENYPFMHPDGRTLYFSSKGHNSMGGYDVFKCEMDPNTGQFGPAVNVDFAISSPDDDLFYIADLNSIYAYFASSRSSELGRLHVYKVKIKPSDSRLAFIKGKFIAGEDGKPVTIRVEDAATNREIGTYQSDPNTGEYIMDLPKSGKYKFYVEKDGDATVHSGMFEVPTANTNVVFAQEMTFTKMHGTDQLVLNNLFDQPLLNEDMAQLMQQALKRKGQLEVNAVETEEDLVSEEEGTIEDAFIAAGFDSNLSNEEVMEKAETHSAELAETSAQDLADAKMSYAYADYKLNEATSFLNEATRLYEEAKVEVDAGKKERMLVEAAYKRNEGQAKLQEAKNALELSKELDKSGKQKYDRYVIAQEQSDQLKTTMESGDRDALVASLTKQKEVLDMEEFPSTLEVIQKRSSDKRAQISKALDFSQNLKSEKKHLEDRLAGKKKQLETVEKKKDRDLLEQDIAGLEVEIEDYNVEIEGAKKRYENRLRDQSNIEEQGNLYAEYQLNQEGSLWSTLKPKEYEVDDINTFNRAIKAGQKEAEAIAISDVEIAQILAERKDLSHDFAFGEIVRDENATATTTEEETFEEVIPDDLEFVSDEEEEEVPVFNETLVEPEEDYQMFLVEARENKESARDRIKVFKSNLEEATPEQQEILNQRISELEQIVEEEELADDPSTEEITDIDPTDETPTDEIVEDTTGTAEEIADDTTELVEDTTDQIEETTDEIEDTTSQFDDITEDTTDQVEDITDEVEDTTSQFDDVVEDTTDSIEETVEDDATIDVTDENTSAVDPTIEEMSNNDLSGATFGDFGSWIMPSYEEQKEEILSSSDAPTMKRDRLLELNASFLTNIKNTKRELQDYYSAQGTLATDDAINNLAAMEEFELSVENENVDEIVAANTTEELADTPDDNPTEDTDTQEDVVTEDTAVKDDATETTEETDSNSDTSVDFPTGNLFDMPVVSETSDLKTADDQKSEDEIKDLASGTQAEVIVEEYFADIEDVDYNGKSELSQNNTKWNLSNELFRELEVRESAVANKLAADPNNNGLEAELKNIQTIKEATAYEMDALQLEIANQKDQQVTAQEVANTRVRATYLQESKSIDESTSDPAEAMRQKVILDNQVIYQLESKKKANELRLSQDISNAEKTAIKKENKELENQRSDLEDLNQKRLEQLETNITYDELYKLQSQLNKSIYEEIPEPVLVEDATAQEYQNFQLNSKDAQLLARATKANIKSLNDPNADLSDTERVDKSVTTGKLLTEASAIEMEQLKSGLESDMLLMSSDEPIAVTAKEWYDEGKEWEQQADELRLTDGMSKEEENEVLKKKVAAQQNAIVMYRRSSAAMKSLRGEQLDDNDVAALYGNEKAVQKSPVTFTDQLFDGASDVSLVDDNTSEDTIAEEAEKNNDVVEDTTDTIVTEDTTEEDSSVETTEEETADTTTETEETIDDTPVVEDTIEDTQDDVVETTDDLEVTQPDATEDPVEEVVETTENSVEEVVETTEEVREDTTPELEKKDPTPASLAQAETSLEREGVPKIEAYKVGSIDLDVNVKNEINEANPDWPPKQKQVAYSKAMLNQLGDMENTELENQKQYKEILTMKRQGLQVVEESIADQGMTEVLQNEQLRLESEIQTLEEYQEVSENNLREFRTQRAVENKKIKVLEEEIAAEISLSEFEMDESLTTPAIPGVLKKNIFVRSEGATSAYSDANPIPVDPVMPEGVIYQVQVGAFRNPIPQDHFKGFSPIIGQKIPSGITRYKVGFFTDFNSADVAKDEIRAKGYTDAFVVVFNNGKKISLAQARLLLQEQPDGTAVLVEENTSDTSDSNSSNQGDSTSGDTNNNDTGTSQPFSGDIQEEFVYDETKDDYYNDPAAAKATQVEMIPGLFYTVQIGAYSKPVTSAQLNNIDPLNSELTESGIIRYTSGIYNNVAAASAWKEQIQAGGIEDAFVSAYYNGVRISIAKAKDVLARKGDGIYVDPSNVLEGNQASGTNTANTGTRSKEEVIDAAQSIIESGLPTEMVFELLEEEGLIDEVNEDNTFKVILGPFAEAIPTREVEIILNFRDNIQFEQRMDNTYVYSSINPIPYEEAKDLKQRLESEGINTAKIVTFNGGREITLEELLEQLQE